MNAQADRIKQQQHRTAMSPSLVHLPNGQTLTVSPVFGGLFFKAADLNLHHSVVPPGWTIILNCEDGDDDPTTTPASHSGGEGATPANGDHHGTAKKPHVHRFRKPTLRNDHLYISSISNPSSSDFRPAISATRQIAMMLWVTLWWYFHQPEPSNHLTTSASENTPDNGKPKGDWRVNINREGILKGKHLLPKLERMGLIASEDSTVGLDPEDGVSTASEGWSKMFVSRRSFWQLDPRIYLFSLTPVNHGTPFPSLSPANSRPASPNRNSNSHTLTIGRADEPNTSLALQGRSITPPGPYTSNSHLPTFYPPPPLQYTFTNHIRHPIRPKPPRQGETFYTRYIPSLGQYLSFRVASLSKKPVPHAGPTSHAHGSGADPSHNPAKEIMRLSGSNNAAAASSSSSPSSPSTPSPGAAAPDSQPDTLTLSDLDLLHKWMNDPRVSASWGEQGPRAHQENFLRTNLCSAHSFPVIGCFDGRPFGYFELYWVKEDRLAAHVGGDCGDWDRGFHCLVGEADFRGPHRVRVWLSALVHYALLADSRTAAVVLEPRVDNLKLRKYCEEVGFFKEREVSFPHKQSNLMKIRRESWDGPAL